MAEQRELDGTLASAIPGIQHLRERIDELEAENATLRKLCEEMLKSLELVQDALDGRYDGADDSRTKWMGELLLSMYSLIPEAKEVLNG